MKAALTGRFFLFARLCLANAHKMRYHNYMDMQYLLWLQSIRMQAEPTIEIIMAALSDSAAFFVAVTCALCVLVDKKKFYRVLFCYSICVTVNAFVKITACVYRPWIREPRIVPAKNSLGAATGYSFPSGHTAAAASCSLGIIWQYRGKKILAALLSLYVLIVAFSRNFLGCHTPQDILFALAEAAFAVVAGSALAKHAEDKEGADKVILVAASAMFAALVAYVFVKPYPVDMDAAGQILVDPKVMQNDAMFDFSFALGFVHAWFLERRFIKFSTDNLNAKKRLLRLAVVLFFALAITFVVYPAAKCCFDKRLAKFIKGYLFSFAAVYLTPLVFTKIERALKW